MWVEYPPIIVLFVALLHLQQGKNQQLAFLLTDHQMNTK